MRGDLGGFQQCKH